MGIVGTALSYRFLRHRYPGGRGVPMGEGDRFTRTGMSKLAYYFGDGLFEELRDKVVVDFGCGSGGNALELAERGCRRVIGVDIQDRLLAEGREAAATRGLSNRVQFATTYDGMADVVMSTDAFEHFADPAAMLNLMGAMLKHDGYLLIEFGPTWYHPLGGHLFSVFPWAHLLFTEAVLIRWRSDFKSDGARRFEECAGGLNRMTISQWERIVQENGFEFSLYTLRPINAVRSFHCRITRELFTAVVVARLTRA
jgi:SAM-dependent methyltransferase